MGNTAHSWLWPGEDIVYWARQSWRQALKIAMVSWAAAALAGAGFAIFGDEKEAIFFLVSAAVSALAVGLPHFLASYRRLEFVLTSHRIFYRSGLIWRRAGEIAFADITDIDGPVPGGHSFMLKLSGGGSLIVHGLPDIVRLRDTLAKAVGLS